MLKEDERYPTLQEVAERLKVTRRGAKDLDREGPGRADDERCSRRRENDSGRWASLRFRALRDLCCL